MQLKNVLILCLIVGALSAAGTRYLFPQIETRNVEVEKEIIRNDVRTITRVVERSDGTKETITESTDRSVKKETNTKESTTYAKSKYLVDLSARAKVTDIKDIVYEVQIQKRIAGPIFAGVKAGTDKSVGLSVGLEF